MSCPPTQLLPDASVRVLVIDAHEVTRVGHGLLLQRQPWVERCLLSADREEAIAVLRARRPHVALLDVSDLGPFAGATVSSLRAAHPAVQILLTTRCRRTAAIAPERLGAAGFLPATSTTADTVAAVRAAVLGFPVPEPAVPGEDAVRLTSREQEVLELLATGATNREIADRLHLGPDTVKKHAATLYRKLGVRNRTEAVRRASELLVAA